MSNAILTSSQYQNYRRIDLIVIHCSATRATQRYTVDDCRRDHRARGFADIGYHYYITRDGVVHRGRPLYTVGAIATGYNAHSIGICYEGGLNARDRPEDTCTPEQKETLQRLLERLKEDYPDARVVGHWDLPGVKKDCPCFDVNGASFME
ncbi:MAG: N-acetylmuramoyl-L-alanine amidase [Bacteroidaceae bacterium]|nr:N-acetylmuramoyl-L-alanine amidase [Bacteroidaceae bacterium]